MLLPWLPQSQQNLHVMLHLSSWGLFPFSSCIHDIACLRSLCSRKNHCSSCMANNAMLGGGGWQSLSASCEPLVCLLCFPKLACYGWSSPIFHNLANCCFLSLDFKGNFRANLTLSSSECELARIALPVSNNLFDKRNSWVFCHKFFFCAFSRLYVNCKPKLTN